ncbi:unnamed protein product, partial [Ectocarpus sp. 12 AP-2014]
AADQGHLEVVKALLEGGAKVDVLDHDKWSPRQSAEFRGFLEVAAVLAKDYSVLKEGEGATKGASAALPPAPWHIEIFAQARRSSSNSQVRLDTARQRKLHGVSVAREGVYSRYADIYKDHAAQTYARTIEAFRQERGGLEAYRRRVVKSSTDAERYRGYIEMDTLRDDPHAEEDGLGLLPADDGSTSTNCAASSNGRESGSVAGFSPARSSAKVNVSLSSDKEDGAGGGLVHGDETAEVWPGDGAAPERSVGDDGEWEAPAVSRLDSFTDGENTAAPRRSIGDGGGGGGGGRGCFVDVVPFNNIRAKYLRPWNDTELSRPYHVAPSPTWRADRAVGAQSLASKVGSSITSTDAFSAAGSGQTLEAYRKANLRNPATHRPHSRTLNWKDGKEWRMN